MYLSRTLIWLIATAGFLVVPVATCFFDTLWVPSETLHLQFRGGSLVAIIGEMDGQNQKFWGFAGDFKSRRDDFLVYLPLPWLYWYGPSSKLQIWLVIPLWIPAVCAVLLAARSWRRNHRRARCCRHCGYDLRGNASGICSECGKVIAERAMDCRENE